MKKKIIALLIMLIVLTSSMFSQEAPETSFWINTGLGVNSMSFGGNLNANLSVDDITVTLRFAGNSDAILFGSSLEEIGVLVGWKSRSEYSQFCISGGIASVTSVTSKGLFSKSTEEQSIGLAAEIQYCYPFFDIFGIGTSVYFNVNGVKSVIGVNLNLFLGKLTD